jgi:GH25 family lysozyme M1 (1,4-beta-N-acetylmuramidase)
MRSAGRGNDRRATGVVRPALAALAGATLLASAAVAVPDAADAATVAPTDHVTHPQLDWAGSTVAAHERRAASAPQAVTPAVTQTPGMDVSAHQGSVYWAAAWNNGAKFAYVKATESTTYTNPDFAQQYNGSYTVGMIRGAYHFATPDTSTAVAQADYFVNHGGGWSKDGRTLPPMVDIEYNPYGDECYGKTAAEMVAWIRDFVDEVHARTTRWPTLYTTTGWWTACTGDTAAFAGDDPLFVAHYAASVGTLPAGWAFHTFWQYADSGTFPGDQDRFNGALANLRNLANNA